MLRRGVSGCPRHGENVILSIACGRPSNSCPFFLLRLGKDPDLGWQVNSRLAFYIRGWQQSNSWEAARDRQGAASKLMAGEQDKEVGVGLEMRKTTVSEGQQASRAPPERLSTRQAGDRH